MARRYCLLRMRKNFFGVNLLESSLRVCNWIFLPEYPKVSVYSFMIAPRDSVDAESRDRRSYEKFGLPSPPYRVLFEHSQCALR